MIILVKFPILRLNFRNFMLQYKLVPFYANVFTISRMLLVTNVCIKFLCGMHETRIWLLALINNIKEAKMFQAVFTIWLSWYLCGLSLNHLWNIILSIMMSLHTYLSKTWSEGAFTIVCFDLINIMYFMCTQ